MSDTKYQGDADAVVKPLGKGLGALEAACAPEQIATQHWNVLGKDSNLPAAMFSQSRVRHNPAWMQCFVNEYGAELAPHDKTMMAPRLFQRQLAGGAWGTALATAHQTHTACAHGVRRMLMVSQLVGKRNMAILIELLTDPTFEFFCLVDAAGQVNQLAAFFGKAGRPIQMLIELDVQGGCTGVRDNVQLQSVLDALTRTDGAVKLAGVEIYESVIKEEADIRTFLQCAVKAMGDLAKGRCPQRTSVVLTGTGPAWYNVTAEEFAKVNIDQPLDVMLRPGRHLTHDVGICHATQTRIDTSNPIAHEMRSSLLPALQFWAYVQSVPEVKRAIIAMDKHDAVFDADLSLPVPHLRPDDRTPSTTPAHWEVTGMMDQHAYLKIVPGDDIKVGDMIALDISHPCLTFDKQHQVSVVNDAYNVVSVVQTYF